MSTVLESLNQGLMRAMDADERVYILGEDVLDRIFQRFCIGK